MVYLGTVALHDGCCSLITRCCHSLVNQHGEQADREAEPSTRLFHS